MTTYTVKSNRSSYHIDGMPTRSKGLGQDTGKGHVSYFADSTCGALTRGRFQDDFQTEDIAEALAKQQQLARIYNRKACLNCSKAAEEILAESSTATKDKHRITMEFIGTDSENQRGFKARFGIACSCGDLPWSESFGGPDAALQIEQHLAAVGLTESFTQHEA
jgi:hypothetical protein